MLSKCSCWESTLINYFAAIFAEQGHKQQLQFWRVTPTEAAKYRYKCEYPQRQNIIWVAQTVSNTICFTHRIVRICPSVVIDLLSGTGEYDVTGIPIHILVKPWNQIMKPRNLLNTHNKSWDNKVSNLYSVSPFCTQANLYSKDTGEKAKQAGEKEKKKRNACQGTFSKDNEVCPLYWSCESQISWVQCFLFACFFYFNSVITRGNTLNYVRFLLECTQY